MPESKHFFSTHGRLLILAGLVIFCSYPAHAGRKGWKQQEVNWHGPGGSRIKAIHYPAESRPPLRHKKHPRKPKKLRKKALPAKVASRLTGLAEISDAPIYATVIDSPPIDGFLPWVATAITDKRHPATEFGGILTAEPATTVLGGYLTGNPQQNFAFGIFDTGAGAHVINHAAALQASLTGPYLTSNEVEIMGVIGSVPAKVSQPIGIYVDGIGAVEPNGLLHDTSGMVGEWNTTVCVGDDIESPNLPTAIGAPLSVFFAAEFRNDLETMAVRNDVNFVSPDIFFYDLDDPCIPGYANKIPLELRPLGGASVSYTPTLVEVAPLIYEYVPASPSIVMGGLDLLQSLFFVHSVDLYEGDQSAIDKDRFLFDTGAQVTVVGSRIAARLALDIADPNFQVKIEDVTGATTTADGFYVDEIQIPALGEWLTATNVPVILFDVPSPEGGTLDGIIGMNLFTDLNFVFHGGGLFGQADPAVEFGPIPYHIVADVYPRAGDGVVDNLDLAAFADAWLAIFEPPTVNWNYKCDMAPQANPDGIINFGDFAVFAAHWGETTP